MELLTNKIKMKELLQEHRRLIAVYLVWIFINIIILQISFGESERAYFWPFDGGDLTGLDDTYDFSEFLVYAIGPAVIFIAYVMFTKKTKL